jgi:excisionase family DNA binding protein
MSNNVIPATYTVRELAEILRIGRNKAYGLVHNKKIGAIKMGREYRIPKICVERFLNERLHT